MSAHDRWLSTLWNGRSVVVGTPSKPQDHSHTLQTGDSVIAASRAMRLYEEETKRSNRWSYFCGWMAWLGGFLLFLGVFIIVGWNIETKWVALVPSVLAWGAWILLWGRDV